MSDDRSTEPMILSDLINRVLDKGVVINGHVTISIADIDLLEVDLRLLLTSVETAARKQMRAPPLLQDAASSLLPARKRR